MKVFCKPSHPAVTGGKYTQVIVAQGCKADRADLTQMLQLFKEECELKHPLKWIGLVTTGPGCGGSGGRHDAMFVIHQDDIGGFAFNMALREAFSMRWLEDAYDSGGTELYPDWFIHKYPSTWNSSSSGSAGGPAGAVVLQAHADTMAWLLCRGGGGGGTRQ